MRESRSMDAHTGNPPRGARKRDAHERSVLAAEAHAGFPRRGRSPARREARARLARVLWDRAGERRLPGGAALDAALAQLPAAELWWMCELAPLGPLYLLPTRPFVRALARTIVQLGARRVLEVAAGDGFLSRALRAEAPELTVIASDSGAWQRPAARMRPDEIARHRGTPVPGLALGEEVVKLEARRAIRAYAPDLVLASWLPPSSLLDALVRAPVRHVLEIGAGGGITASAYSWRFAHEFLEGALERTARCRLDARPRERLHSRITLYFGAAHPEHHEERVRPGDFLYQFKPSRSPAATNASRPRE